MDVVFVLTSSLFFLWILRDIFFWLALWQENEYRYDRFFASLKKIIKKPKFSSLALFIGKWLIFFSYGFVIFNDDLQTPYHYLIIFLYLLQGFLLLQEIYLNNLKKPFLTIREVSIFAAVLAVVLLLFAVPLMDMFFWLLFIDLLIGSLVFFFVSIFLFPVEIFHDWQIEKAIRKMRTNQNLLVIAVTGSIGKSVTKDYLASILKRQFSVIKTEGKNNTAIGVARTILKKIDTDTQIFVAEISAYKRGEIAMLCQLIKPKIGILTAINNQYLSLFKSLENIKKTNFELVESLPKNGYCLFNGNNKNTLSLYKKSKKNKVLYQTVQTIPEQKKEQEIIAYRIIMKPKKVNFCVWLSGKEVEFRTASSVHIDQLLPALYIAFSLGMSEQKLKHEVALLQ
jgi:UDP-N-acetylmuramoyl-tripeptide--D-alanyl-D-alanine ligase